MNRVGSDSVLAFTREAAEKIKIQISFTDRVLDNDLAGDAISYIKSTVTRYSRNISNGGVKIPVIAALECPH